MKRTLSSRLAQLRRTDSVDLTDEPAFHGLIGYTTDARGWDPATATLTVPVDAATARALHQGGRTVSQVSRCNGHLVVVTLSSSGEIKVGRFDRSDTYAAEIREFRLVEDRVWLRSIKLTNGDEQVHGPDRIVTDWFTWVQPDTTATWTRFDQRSPQGRAQELRLDWDPAANWFAVPTFGDYEHLIEPPGLLARLWPSATRPQLTS